MPSDARCTHNTIPLAPRTGEAAFVPCPWLLARSRRAGREGAGSLCIGRCGGLPPRAARVVCAIRLPAAEGRLKPYVRPLRGCPPLRFAGDTAHPRRGWHLLGRSLSMGRCRAGRGSGQSWRARKLFPWWRWVGSGRIIGPRRRAGSEKLSPMYQSR